jgi:hypothetical protein
MAKIPLNSDNTETTNPIDPETDSALLGIAGIVKIGSYVFIRTVTYHAIGQVVGIYPAGLGSQDTWVKLDKGIFVKDSGEFTTVLFGKAEVHNWEPMPDGYLVNTHCVTDIIPWNNPMPKAKKK